jgi:predicted DNA-binding protein (MmcQ/YjbR family)
MLPHWTISPERLERLRGICLALPDASEKVAWGDPTWRVRDRIFAMQKGNYDGGRPSLWLKGAPGAQEALVGARPSLFFVPPYVGNKGWVGIYLDGGSMEWEVVADLIVESWRLIAGPRLSASLPEGPPAPLAKKKAPARKTSARKKSPARRAKKRTAAKR